jgi:hypothetical protein
MQQVKVREIDGETYLFVNFTNELDIAENTTFYVYKRAEEK